MFSLGGHALRLAVHYLALGSAFALDGGTSIGVLRDGVSERDGGEERQGEAVVQHVDSAFVALDFRNLAAKGRTFVVRL